MLLSSTTTKLLDFSRKPHCHFARSHAAKCVQNERCTVFAPHTLLFDQCNKLFGSDFENLTCPLPAFTHALIFSKVFNNLVDGKLTPTQIACSVRVHELSNEFQF